MNEPATKSKRCDIENCQNSVLYKYGKPKYCKTCADKRRDELNRKLMKTYYQKHRQEIINKRKEKIEMSK